MIKNFSVRSFLVFLAVSFTTVPVLLLGVYTGRSGVERTNQQALELNRQGALLIERDIASEVSRFKALFEALSADVDLRTLRFRDEARAIEVLRKYPQVSVISLLNEKAISVAGYSLQGYARTGIDYSDRESNHRSRATRETAISGNLESRTTNLPSIIFSVPLLDEKGSIVGFLGGTVPTGQFRAAYELPSEQFSIVLDSFGRLVSSTNAKDPERPAAVLAKAPLGDSRIKTDQIDSLVWIVEVQPIGWRVAVGFPGSYLTARALEAIRSTVFVGVLCALVGAGLAGIIAFATTRGLDSISQQVQRMPAADPQPIVLTESGIYPMEVRSLIGNFNNLLDRTARTRQAEFEAISKVVDTILIARSDGQITYVNEAGARLFGDIVGKPLESVIGAENAAIIMLPEAPRDWKRDVSLTKIDGSTFDGFLSSTSILDENNKLTSTVAIVQDITEEKAAREAMVQSEKMITLGELVAGTSHELNNPLAIMTGYSDLLLEEIKLSPEQRAKVESIRKNAIRASNVVHSLLAFARKRKPERKRTDVNTVVEAALELKEYDLRTSGIGVDRQLTPNLPFVFADSNQIQQVILNVINNAQDAVLGSSRTPTIVIRTETSDGRVFIKIEDSGTGISKADLKKVFNPFFTTKPVGKGTGLGLSISYGIIREHGGTIRIQSQPGQGTEVCIELPIDQSNSLSALVSGAVVGVISERRFLVVDDEADMANILQVGLSRKGNAVDTAGNIEDALQLAQTRYYDYIITDMKMPGGNGIDLYRKLCAISPSYSTRVVFLTGDTSNPSTIQFLEKEGLPYFSKPFDLESMHDFFAKRESRPAPG